MKIELLNKFTPWLLIVIGFFSLNMFHGAISIMCFVVGIVMMIERKCPEKWGSECENQ